MQLPSSYESRSTNVNRTQDHNSTAFSSRMKALVDQLSIVETEYNKRKDVGLNSMEPEEDTKEICRLQTKEGSRKRKHETHKFRGRQSIFKRPEGPAPRSIYRSVPDYHRNPHKWTKYSLDDVSNEDMTDRSNTRAALSFLKELKARKEAKLAEEMDIDKMTPSSNDNKISFRSRKNESISNITFKKPESVSSIPECSSVIVHTDDKPIFKNSKIIMPEYVVGQKQIKKIKKDKPLNKPCSSKQIKLDHLQDLDEDEN